MKSAQVEPRYGHGCFADIPASVYAWLAGHERAVLDSRLALNLPQRLETVVLFFIDALGWEMLQRWGASHPLLRRLRTQGIVKQMTAQFPSTTAAHTTTIHTGLTPGQSGVYEWYYYEPALDTIIAPLLFSFSGTKERDTLKPTGVDPRHLYPTHTLYQELHAAGIASHVFQARDILPSTFSSVVLDGAQPVPYTTLPEALVNLRLLLERQAGPAYYFCYFDRIDAICHQYGPNSLHVAAEIDACLTALESWFRRLPRTLRNTLIILTADHGQMAVDPRTTVYLNAGERFAGLERFLRRNRRGELLVPAGSPRDMFLYVEDGASAEAREFLAERLAGTADVHEVRDLAARGYFGPPPLSSEFWSRAGDLVILPYAGEAVWWYEKDRFEQKFYGHHGGLAPQEMEIPLLLYAL